MFFKVGQIISAYTLISLSLSSLIKLYFSSDSDKRTSISTGLIAGIAVGSAILVLVLLGVGLYAVRQKKRAEKAIGMSRPFGNYYIKYLLLCNPRFRYLYVVGKIKHQTNCWLVWLIFTLFQLPGHQVAKTVEVHHN